MGAYKRSMDKNLYDIGSRGMVWVDRANHLINSVIDFENSTLPQTLRAMEWTSVRTDVEAHIEAGEALNEEAKALLEHHDGEIRETILHAITQQCIAIEYLAGYLVIGDDALRVTYGLGQHISDAKG